MNDDHRQHQGTTSIAIISKSVVMRLAHTINIILHISSSSLHSLTMHWHEVRIMVTLIMIEGAREAGAAHMWAVWETVCSVLQPEDTLENTFWGLYSQDKIRNWKKGIRGKCSSPKIRPDKTIATILFQPNDGITSILFQVKPFQCRHDPSACRVAFTTKQCLQVTMSFCHPCKISA